jgi:hypothetical protein
MRKRASLDSGFRVQRRPVGFVNEVLCCEGRGKRHRSIEAGAQRAPSQGLVGSIFEGTGESTAENGHNFSLSSFSTAREASWARDFRCL